MVSLWPTIANEVIYKIEKSIFDILAALDIFHDKFLFSRVESIMIEIWSNFSLQQMARMAITCIWFYDNLIEELTLFYQGTTLGGKVKMPRIAVPGMGYLAVCSDTENNTFGLWENDTTAK